MSGWEIVQRNYTRTEPRVAFYFRRGQPIAHPTEAINRLVRNKFGKNPWMLLMTNPGENRLRMVLSGTSPGDHARKYPASGAITSETLLRDTFDIREGQKITIDMELVEETDDTMVWEGSYIQPKEAQ